MITNFSFLEQHDPLLSQLDLATEGALVADLNTSLVKFRQLGEAIAQDIGSRLGIEFDDRLSQLDLLSKLQFEVDISRKEREEAEASVKTPKMHKARMCT